MNTLIEMLFPDEAMNGMHAATEAATIAHGLYYHDEPCWMDLLTDAAAKAKGDEN